MLHKLPNNFYIGYCLNNFTIVSPARVLSVGLLDRGSDFQ